MKKVYQFRLFFINFIHLVLFISYFSITTVNSLSFNYHSQEELEELLYEFRDKVNEPLRANLYSIGKSNEGRDLLVLELTASHNNSDIVPNVQLTGNIHGNEPPGKEILLHFIDYLISSYWEDEKVNWLLNNTRIHILPCLNPDGWIRADPNDCVGVKGRYNAKNHDLNRNFPEFMNDESSLKEEQVETEAIRKWMNDVSFVLSGDFHAGAIVAIYPFHRIIKSKYGYEMQSSVTPDNNIFVHLANAYSKNNKVMFEQSIFCDNETFDGGITRGAAWYYFLGGMQDYSYMKHGTMALTFEISCCKFPPENELKIIWEQNKFSLLEFCSEANRGITILIKDKETDSVIPNANITILGIDKIFRTNSQGKFWKILLSGKYYLRVEAENFTTIDTNFEIENYDKFPKMTSLDLCMTKKTS